MGKRLPRPKGIKWELPKIEGEEVVACEICGGEGVAAEIEIFHRGCRLGQAFPDAYEKKDGFLFFDPRKMREHMERDGNAGQEPTDS